MQQGHQCEQGRDMDLQQRQHHRLAGQRGKQGGGGADTQNAQGHDTAGIGETEKARVDQQQ